MASVKWSKSGLDDLETLDPAVRDRVLSKVSWLQENTSRIAPKKLHRELEGLYRLRVGDYRIVYSVRGDVIVVERVGHRRDIYK